jgi:hypothetical protein
MRKESPKTPVIALEDAPTNLDLSRWTGAPPTFEAEAPVGAAAARAAQVADLRRIRDRRLYVGLTRTWDEFCEKHLLISRRSVDRNIRRLKEFGPVFFSVAEALPISSQEYRLIRGHICPNGVRFDGALIPFGPSHTHRLGNVIAELLRRSGPKPVKKNREPFSRVIAQLEAGAKALDRYDRALDKLQKFELSALMGRTARRALELGVRLA